MIVLIICAYLIQIQHAHKIVTLFTSNDMLKHLVVVVQPQIAILGKKPSNSFDA